MQPHKFIKIDLSTGEIAAEAIPEQVVRDFIGGRGFGAYYLYRDVAPGTDPLGPDNRLLLLAGPLAGTGALSASRWMAITKSPLTGAYARSVGGADFGAWLRWMGYSFIQITGKAKKPVYIHFQDDKPRILDAANLWGNEVSPVQELIQKEHGKNIRTVCIGPASEKLVRYASIFSEKRSASRCGVGTVMGSKNLKAIAITTNRGRERKALCHARAGGVSGGVPGIYSL